MWLRSSGSSLELLEEVLSLCSVNATSCTDQRTHGHKQTRRRPKQDLKCNFLDIDLYDTFHTLFFIDSLWRMINETWRSAVVKFVRIQHGNRKKNVWLVETISNILSFCFTNYLKHVKTSQYWLVVQGFIIKIKQVFSRNQNADRPTGSNLKKRLYNWLYNLNIKHDTYLGEHEATRDIRS